LCDFFDTLQEDAERLVIIRDAFANMQTTYNGVETTKTQAGWTAGAGVEWAFADNWTA